MYEEEQVAGFEQVLKQQNNNVLLHVYNGNSIPAGILYHANTIIYTVELQYFGQIS